MIFEKYKPLILGLWALFSFSVYSGNIYAKQTENTTVPQPVQNATVKGVVKDATGEPLIGVSVVVKGTTNGAVTDVNGNFSIACSANDILVFSYIGYDKIEVKAGNASFHTITMKEDSELLDEVIVIGYGTTTRKHVIGAVDQIRDDVIKDRPVANITQALQGATPSLSIQQRNMNPNNNNININNTYRCDEMDSIDKIDRKEIKAELKKQLNYENLISRNEADKKQINSIINILADVMSSRSQSIRIGGENKPLEEVIQRFKQLTDKHIAYVLECLNKNADKPRNIRAYLLTSLFNAPSTMDCYYARDADQVETKQYSFDIEEIKSLTNSFSGL